MAGGYENEDMQAELEEVRRKKEAQMRAWMDEERRERERLRLEREARQAAAGNDPDAHDGNAPGETPGSGPQRP